MIISTDLSITLIALLSCIGLGCLFYVLGTRPRESLKPRMMPWRFMAFGLFATAMMVLVHLVNLLGWKTGR